MVLGEKITIAQHDFLLPHRVRQTRSFCRGEAFRAIWQTNDYLAQSLILSPIVVYRQAFRSG